MVEQVVFLRVESRELFFELHLERSDGLLLVVDGILERCEDINPTVELEVVPWCSGFFGCAWDWTWELTAADFVDGGAHSDGGACGWAAASIIPFGKIKVLGKLGYAEDHRALIDAFKLSDNASGVDLLRALLPQEKFDDVFKASGELQPWQLLKGEELDLAAGAIENPAVVSALTTGRNAGTQITDWRKHALVVRHDNVEIEVHYYFNHSVGRADFSQDYSMRGKVNFDGTG